MVTVLTPRKKTGLLEGLGYGAAASLNQYGEEKSAKKRLLDERSREDKLRKEKKDQEEESLKSNAQVIKNVYGLDVSGAGSEAIQKLLVEKHIHDKEQTAKQKVEKDKANAKSQEDLKDEQRGKNRVFDIAKQRGKSDAEAQGDADRYWDKPDLYERVTKPAKAEKPERDIFNEEYEKGAAKQYLEDIDEIPRLKQSIATIDDSIKTYSKMPGFGGSILSPRKTAGEWQKVTGPLYQQLEQVVKAIVPRGALSDFKTRTILEQNIPTFWDSRPRAEAKMRNLRNISNNALQRVQGRVDLIKQFAGAPPLDILQKYDAETQQYKQALEFKNPPGTIKDGKMYGLVEKSTGKPLGKGVPVNDAEEGLESGELDYEQY